MLDDLELADELAETGNTKRGEELLNEVIQRDSNSLEAHLGLGRTVKPAA